MKTILGATIVAVLMNLGGVRIAHAASGLTLSSRNMNFGKVVYTGDPSNPPTDSRSLTISNPAGHPSISGLAVQISGADGTDFTPDQGCTSDLPAGTNCTLVLTFKPSGLNQRKASLSLSDGHGSQVGKATLAGAGIRPNKLTLPASVSLGSVQLGQSAFGFVGPQNPNPNGASVDVSSITISDPAFSQFNNCIPFVPGGGSCGINITFTPTKVCNSNGMVTATLTIVSDASPTPQKVKLTATVTGVGQPQVFVANAATPDTEVSPLMAYPLPGNINTPSVFIGAIADTFNPADVALSSKGQVFVANNSSPFFGPDNVGSIEVFSPCSDGTAIPDATIVGADTGLEIPTGVAVDSHGKIYVTNQSSNDDLSTGRVTIYAPGSHDDATPIATIEGPDTGLADPRDIALDSKGNLYVVNDGNTSVTIFAPGSSGDSAPLATIVGPETGLDIPDAIGIDHKGVIYIANEAGGPAFFGSIALYPPLGHNHGILDIAPTAVISGDNGSDNTALNLPRGIALDSGSNIYVTNFFGGDSEVGSVTVYGPVGNVTGVLNVAPINTITGSDSMIASPIGIAIGKLTAGH